MPVLSNLLRRAQGKTRRTLAARLHRRMLDIATPRALVSFTFDDAPRSAFGTGARVLEAHDARGTYFVSLGLAGTTTEVGALGDARDLARAVEHGHELGCHTFGHEDAWFTEPGAFIRSVDRNRDTLRQLLPAPAFRSFAYPKSGATAAVKRALAHRFDCCRAGGQTFNSGRVDLSLVSACFIDQRANADMGFISDLIDRNAEAGGWLVFAAHDISDTDWAFGCTPTRFEAVVRRAVDSGAEVLPMAAACSRLRDHASGAEESTSGARPDSNSEPARNLAPR
jgi:peptidoglycan/xylan/chitin deacetylase (PgdA/CDA1 family)